MQPLEPEHQPVAQVVPMAGVRPSIEPTAHLSPAIQPRPRRRWPWVVAIVVLLAVVGATAAYAVDQQQKADANGRSAAQWENRSTHQKAQLTRAAHQLLLYR